MDYGPQSTKDIPFRKRMRFHQSWYRAHVLNVPFGVGPKRKSKSKYGNFLRVVDGDKGLNFLTPHILQIARRRLAQKNAGIDEFRLLNDLLSSQTMCFNLIAPLVDHIDGATRFVYSIASNQINKVQTVALEYVPQPIVDYLNDRTAFNAYISFEQADGGCAFLGIQTRLCGPLPDKVYTNKCYLKWTHTPDSPWPESSWSMLITPRFNHLWRVHLLSVALQKASPNHFSVGQSLFVYHPADMEMKQLLENYRQLLKPGDQTFIAMPLDQIITKWKTVVQTDSEQRWLGDFEKRYLNIDASEAEYKKASN